MNTAPFSDLATGFIAVATRYPDRIALTHAKVRLTYGDLLHKSLGLADRIYTQTGAGNRVALVSPTDEYFVIGLWAILLSGNSCLPLEPEANRDFTSRLLAQTDPKLVLASDPEAFGHFSGMDLPVLALRQPVVSNPLFVPPPRRADSEAVIYFTSGSSGTPKGIAYEDHHLVFDALRQHRALDLSPADHMDLLFSGWFSASAACIFPALLGGLRLCLFSLTQSGLTALSEWFDNEQITVSNLAVSVFRAFARQAKPQQLQSVRYICLSAELATPEDLALFRQVFPPTATLQIAYASTEARTISQSFFTHKSGTSLPDIPLGFPVEGKRIEIRTEAGLAAPGEPGEIVVISPHIPSGYLPPLVSTRHTICPDGVHYATGDMGWQDDLGCLHFAGRKDLQIKVNGKLVQPEVIEQALRQLTGCSEVIAVNHHQRGLGVFVEGDGSAFSDTGWKESLIRLLPPGHVPGWLEFLPLLPKNRNGKADRQALVNWEFAKQASRPSHDHPTLNLIAEAIHSVLGLYPRPDAHFFNDLGGDSLQALEVWAELCQKMEVDLPVELFYFHPTPGALCKAMEAGSSPPCGAKLLAGSGSGPVAVCIAPHPGGLTSYLHFARKWNQEQCLYGLDWPDGNPSDLHRLAASFADRICSISHGQAVQLIGYSFGGWLAYATACVLEQRGVALGPLVLLDAHTYEPTSWWWKLGGYLLSKPGYILGKAGEKLGLIPPKAQVLPLPPADVPYHPLMRGFSQWEKGYSGNLLLFRADVPVASGFHFARGQNWHQYTTGTVTQVWVKGNHNEMVQPAALDVLLAHLLPAPRLMAAHA